MTFTVSLGWTLSRIAFVGTHLVFAYWLNFLLNDPFNLGGSTLDAREVKSAGQCTPLIYENLYRDLALLFGWWFQHSVMARKKVKEIFGSWQHPLDRPIFATFSWLTWLVQIHFWKPITDCSKWNPLNVSRNVWLVSGLVIALGSVLIVGLLWSLPGHVFGTDHWKWQPGKPPHGELIRRFPYGLVRHPAAAGFLWIYWALPAYTPSHLLLASFWTVFIVVGTVFFEEGGLYGPDEFGVAYGAYAKDVNAFFPKPSCIYATLLGPEVKSPHAQKKKST